MKTLRAVVEFIAGFFTDSNGRPEIKALLGGAGIVIAYVWLFTRNDLGGFSAIFGLSSGLLVTKTVEDNRLDKKK